MKRKILIISILVLIFTIVFSINASAKEEPEIDYNNYVAIIQNGETITYPVLGMQQHTWRDYIEAYTNVYGKCPFEIHDKFVTHNGGFITNRTGATVSPDDDIIVASGCVYNILAINNIYTVDENTIAFNARFEGYTFSFLIDCLDEDFNSLLTSKGHNGIYNVLYNSRFIEGQSGPVQPSDTISSKIAYSLGEVVCTEHVWIPYKETNVATCVTPRGYTVKCQQCGAIEPRVGDVDPNAHDLVETIITSPTCEATGTKKRVCELCGYEDNVTIPAKGHKLLITEQKEATCTEYSEIVYVCEVCGFKRTVSEPPLGHAWSEATCIQKSTCFNCGLTQGDLGDHQFKGATCTEPETCITCGLTQGDALGHVWMFDKEDWGICMRCDLGFDFESNQNGTDNDSSNDPIGDYITNISDKLNEGFSEFNTNLEYLFSLLAGLCFFILIVWGISKIIRAIKINKK